MSQVDVDRARRGFEAILRGDLDAVAAFLDEDVRWHGGDPDAEGACRNRDQALRFIRAAMEGGRIGTLVDVVDAGDRVVVVMQPPHGPRRANVTTFRDGRAVEMVAYGSPEEALAAAGQKAN